MSVIVTPKDIRAMQVGCNAIFEKANGRALTLDEMAQIKAMNEAVRQYQDGEITRKQARERFSLPSLPVCAYCGRHQPAAHCEGCGAPQ